MAHRRALDKRQIFKLEMGNKKILDRMSNILITMEHELSLVPKPMKKYRKIATILERLLDLMIGLREVREKIPRKETVSALLSTRRELVSHLSA
jgi:hypothetical protein